MKCLIRGNKFHTEATKLILAEKHIFSIFKEPLNITEKVWPACA